MNEEIVLMMHMHNVISIKLTFMAIFPAAQTIYFPRLVS